MLDKIIEGLDETKKRQLIDRITKKEEESLSELETARCCGDGTGEEETEDVSET